MHPLDEATALAGDPAIRCQLLATSAQIADCRV
jgi:hypothetical protein